MMTLDRSDVDTSAASESGEAYPVSIVAADGAQVRTRSPEPAPPGPSVTIRTSESGTIKIVYDSKIIARRQRILHLNQRKLSSVTSG